MAAAVSLSFFTLSLQLKAHIQCLLVSILSHTVFPSYHVTILCTLPLLSAILTAAIFCFTFLSPSAKYYFTTAFFTTSLSTTMTDVTIPKYHVILSGTRVRAVKICQITDNTTFIGLIPSAASPHSAF